jgi:hypothetical protein
MIRSDHIRLVSPPPEATRPRPAPRPTPDRGDWAVLGMLFGVNLVPLVGAAVAHGRWGAGTLGLATAGALVTGRELALGARSLLHRRR